MVAIRRDSGLTLSERGSSTLLLLLGLALAVVAGIMASEGHDRLSLVTALAIPISVLLIRYPWGGLLLWLGVMPFFVVGDGNAGPDTWLLHRMLIPSMLALTLVYRMLGLSRSHFRLSVTDLAIVAFLLLMVADIQLNSGNPMRMSAAFYDRVIIPISIYWLVRVIEPRDRELRQLLWVLVWVVLLQFVVSSLSWVAPSVLPGAWLGRAGERAVGTVGGPGPYTTTLMLGGLLVVPYLAQARGTLLRLGLYAVVLAAFTGVAISLSRGSWLGAGLAMIGLLIAYRPIALRLVAGFLVIGVGLLLGPMADQATYVADRLGDESTAESRLVTNNAALRMIQERPLTGFGYGNFEDFDESFKVRIGDIPVQPGSAHHTYLALAAENGLTALALYMFPAAWLLWLTLRRWRQVAASGWINRGLLVVLWLAILHQVAVSNFMDMLHSSPWGTGLFWLTLGLIHVIISRASRPPDVRRVAWTSPIRLEA